MHDLNALTTGKPVWRRYEQLDRRAINPALQDLLFSGGSLTQALGDRCAQKLQLQIMQEHWARPFAEERCWLGLADGRYTFTREIQLLCNKTPWLFARTLMPPQILRGRARRLLDIGERPLGSLLFSQPTVAQIRREQRDYACLQDGQYLYNHLQTLLPALTMPAGSCLWARRSSYRLYKFRLGIIEIFLPGL